uniref:Clp protease proteolytic subunit n=1 Tax=Pogoniopsis schenckii TaxID=1582014 RepID=UPI002238637F|nr:Clp protease proteolytic subunit [Pogoniopsis schenckii]UYP51005.1 Clp protease proteolytic subunit [Pogoniopsis schenckii]
MPIGVPKVPFKIFGEENATWIDVYNRLYRDRSLFLSKEINIEISNQISGILIYLNLENENKDIFLYINSPGGWIIPGIAIFDTIQLILPDVNTICIGLAASMGSLILVGGEITKRLSFAHARIMIHQPVCYYNETQVGEFMLEAEELLKLREIITKIYSQRTGNFIWVISEDLERNVFMSSIESYYYGIVDTVAISSQGIFGGEQKYIIPFRV